MKYIDESMLKDKIFIKCGSASDIYHCMYKNKFYIYKKYLQPEEMIDDKFFNRFKILSSKNIKQIVLPNHLVLSSDEPKGYLTSSIERKSIISIEDPLEKYKALIETKKIIQKLHQNDIIHGDIHSGNILVKNNKRCLIDFDNCEIKDSVKLDFNKCSISAMNYINKNGIIKNLDIYMFNVLTFFAFNPCECKSIYLEEIFDSVRNDIYYGKNGIFSNDRSKKACEDIYLLNSSDYLIDTINEKDVKTYKKSLL